MEIRLNLFNKRVLFKIDWRDVRKENTIGYTNRCKDGRYIIMMDYDRTEYQWVKDEIKYLQRQFKLGSFHLFESSEGSYHAVCFDKLTMVMYRNILLSSSVDENYAYIPYRYGRKLWTLRLTDKKGTSVKYKEQIISEWDYIKRFVSSAHIKVIGNLFDIGIFILAG